MAYQTQDYGLRLIAVAVASFVAAFFGTLFVVDVVAPTQQWVANPTLVSNQAASYAVAPRQPNSLAQPGNLVTALQNSEDPGADIEWVEDDVTDVAVTGDHLEFAVFMATKVRLARFGRKKVPFYRVVIADSRAPRDGRFIEKVGTYNPLLENENPDRLNLDVERILFWLDKGAQPTDTVSTLLSQAGLKVPDWLAYKMAKFERNRKKAGATPPRKKADA